MIENVRQVVNVIATDPDTKDSDNLNFHRHVLDFLKYDFIQWGMQLNMIENKPFNKAIRMEFNLRLLENFRNGLGDSLKKNEMQFFVIVLLNPSHSERTYEHRMILCKTYDSPLYCIDNYSNEKLDIKIPLDIREININDFLNSLTRFLLSSETKWNETVGKLYSNIICNDNTDPKLIRKDLIGIPLNPVFMIDQFKRTNIDEKYVNAFLKEFADPNSVSKTRKYLDTKRLTRNFKK